MYRIISWFERNYLALRFIVRDTSIHCTRHFESKCESIAFEVRDNSIRIAGRGGKKLFQPRFNNAYQYTLSLQNVQSDTPFFL